MLRINISDWKTQEKTFRGRLKDKRLKNSKAFLKSYVKNDIVEWKNLITSSWKPVKFLKSE